MSVLVEVVLAVAVQFLIMVKTLEAAVEVPVVMSPHLDKQLALLLSQLQSVLVDLEQVVLNLLTNQEVAQQLHCLEELSLLDMVVAVDMLMLEHREMHL